MGKNVYYRYKTKRFRNLKVSELAHICQTCDCDECPLAQTCFCLIDLHNFDAKLLNHVIHLKYAIPKKKYHFDDGEH